MNPIQSFGVTLPDHVLSGLAQRFTGGAQAQASALQASPFYQQATAAGNQLQQPIAQTLKTISAPALNPEVNQKVVQGLSSPLSTFGTPVLKKVGVPAGVATAIGAVGDFATPTGEVGEAYRVMKLEDLLKAKNTLTAATEKPGSVMHQMNALANGTADPIKIRQAQEGLVIEDGRHRLEAAKQLGLPEMLVQDVTKEYAQPRDAVGRFDTK